jgi:hypothetical protein
MATKGCKIFLLIFALLYAGALLLFLIGTFGWFGQDRDQLAGLFLIPLGLPWNLFLDTVPDPFRAWATAAAPLVTILLLGVTCLRFRPSH